MLFIWLSSLAFAWQPPVVNGQLTSDFPQVGIFLAYDGEQGGVDFCSGTLIHSKWVLTAAHCVDAMDSFVNDGLEILFIIGNSLLSDSSLIGYDKAQSWITHPDFSVVQLRYDIGLVELQSGLSSISPLPLSEEDPAVWGSGLELQFVGWGVTGEEQLDSGEKRLATIPFYAFDDQFIYAIDPDGVQNLCSGDSGGAALKKNAAGGYEIIGVNAFVFANISDTPCTGGGTGATRVDRNVEWIYQYVPVNEIASDADQSGPTPTKASLGSDKANSSCAHLDMGSPILLLIAILAFTIRKD